MIALTALGHFALELAHGFLPVVYPLLQERMGLSYTQIGLVALAPDGRTLLGTRGVHAHPDLPPPLT